MLRMARCGPNILPQVQQHLRMLTAEHRGHDGASPLIWRYLDEAAYLLNSGWSAALSTTEGADYGAYAALLQALPGSGAGLDLNTIVVALVRACLLARMERLSAPYSLPRLRAMYDAAYAALPAQVAAGVASHEDLSRVVDNAREVVTSHARLTALHAAVTRAPRVPPEAVTEAVVTCLTPLVHYHTLKQLLARSAKAGAYVAARAAYLAIVVFVHTLLLHVATTCFEGPGSAAFRRAVPRASKAIQTAWGAKLRHMLIRLSSLLQHEDDARGAGAEPTHADHVPRASGIPAVVRQVNLQQMEVRSRANTLQQKQALLHAQQSSLRTVLAAQASAAAAERTAVRRLWATRIAIVLTLLMAAALVIVRMYTANYALTAIAAAFIVAYLAYLMRAPG